MIGTFLSRLFLFGIRGILLFCVFAVCLYIRLYLQIFLAT